mmetsp:Transcript_36233/g.72043  ORF Transcript_36233/g.72043 Transcript_36233/m.72043 type:complete len:201 (-) Transcript_36233:108-710(-)
MPRAPSADCARALGTSAAEQARRSSPRAELGAPHQRQLRSPPPCRAPLSCHGRRSHQTSEAGLRSSPAQKRPTRWHRPPEALRRTAAVAWSRKLAARAAPSLFGPLGEPRGVPRCRCSARWQRQRQKRRLRSRQARSRVLAARMRFLYSEQERQLSTLALLSRRPCSCSSFASSSSPACSRLSLRSAARRGARETAAHGS